MGLIYKVYDTVLKEIVALKTLRTMLEELPAGTRLPIAETLDTLDQLCAALEYAHQYTIHRDIKPDNVMIGSDGKVKLMDFGISKLRSSSLLTETSVVMSTPFYMSPEQLRSSKNVDARADIYSLGVMLYEILTGNIPTGLLKPASQLVRGVPSALDPVVARCVDADRAKHYASAAELREDLAQIAAQLEPASALEIDNATPEVPEVPKAHIRKNSGLLSYINNILGLAFSFFLVSGLVFYVGKCSRDEEAMNEFVRPFLDTTSRPKQKTGGRFMPQTYQFRTEPQSERELEAQTERELRASSEEIFANLHRISSSSSIGQERVESILGVSSPVRVGRAFDIIVDYELPGYIVVRVHFINGRADFVEVSDHQQSWWLEEAP